MSGFSKATPSFRDEEADKTDGLSVHAQLKLRAASPEHHKPKMVANLVIGRVYSGQINVETKGLMRRHHVINGLKKGTKTAKFPFTYYYGTKFEGSPRGTKILDLTDEEWLVEIELSHHTIEGLREFGMIKIFDL